MACGSSTYDHHERLASVPADLDIVSDLFQRLGYDAGPRLQDTTTDALRRGLSHWAAAEDRCDDALVLYYSGHGERDHNRHYVLCRDSVSGQLGGTALATEEVVRIVTEGGIERLLLIVDTCYAGQGGVDAARSVAEDLGAALTGTRAADESRLTAFSVIAAARTHEAAVDGVFARALRDAVDDPTLGGQRQRKLYLEEVVDRVNESLAANGPFQHASWGTLPSGEGFAFIPNPRYAPEVPDGIDLAEQRTWYSPEGRRRREELLSHFDPRGRGADALSGRGSYFTGRTKALAELARWLAAPPAEPGRCVVVTGGAGVGKSALVGRLVLDARRDGTSLTAIHARHKLLEEITSGIADAAGMAAGTPAATDPERLVAVLSARSDPLHVVVDSLDEAGTAGADSEPERIAAQLLRPLADVPCVRLLIGTRPRAVPALGTAFARLDLDEPRWTEPGDLQAYAAQLLLAPDGPGSTGPYTGTSAPMVAAAVEDRAHGNYLVTRLVARSLAHRAAPLDTTAPGWQAQLPAPAVDPLSPTAPASGPAFRWALRQQFHDQESRGRALLTALALAEGAGLPAGEIWRAAASALTGDAVGPRDLRWLLRTGGSHIVEDVDATGRSVYRLYHESFVDELRTEVTQATLRQIAEALVRLVPLTADGSGPDWPAADPYLREHLPTHAAAGGLLDALAADPLFLVTMAPTVLRRALAGVHTPRALAVRSTFERIAPLLATEADPAARAALLRLTALEAGDGELADAALRRGPRPPWLVEWAYVPSPPYAHRSVGGLRQGTSDLALLDCDGRHSLVTLEGGQRLMVWDVETSELLGELPELPGEPQWGRSVSHLAVCPGGGGRWLLVGVSDGPEGHIQLWDVGRRAPLGRAVRASVNALALLELDGRPVAGVLTGEGEVLLVDMADGAELCRLGSGATGRWQWDSRLAMGAHRGEVVVAVMSRDGMMPMEETIEVERWRLSPENGWGTTEHRTWHLRGTFERDLVVHEGQAVAATLDSDLAHRGEPVDALVHHGDGCQEWTRKGTVGMLGEERLVRTGRGLVRLAVDLGGAEAVAPTGRSVAVLHADLGSMPRFATLVTGPDEVLLATAESAQPAVSLWSLRTDAAHAGGTKPRRFSALFDTTLSMGRVAGRDVLALGDGRAVRCLDPATGRLLAWQPKRRSDLVTGSVGLPLVVRGNRVRSAAYRRVRLVGSPRRHLLLRDCPPGASSWVEPVVQDGHKGVLAVFGQHVIVWSTQGRRLCETTLAGKPHVLTQRTVAGRLYLAYFAYEHGLSVIDMSAGTTVFHRRDGYTASGVSPGMPFFWRPGGIALDDWGGEPVVGHLTHHSGIKVYGVRDGTERWSWTWPEEWGHHGRFKEIYLHRVADRRVVLTVGFDDALTVLDIGGDRVAARIAMGAQIQCVTPLPDGGVAVVTATGLYSLRFPALMSAPSTGRS
ncbi:hypothetical protein GCM10010449_60310 [Streptomyces rectiviolaceus]|uniref:Peptidase C14 caspase domain-containing protein n=1 Tax=Streptomyces rectiviolaceus TaxID=332591 RepID=A0ABP6N401_9ACTN